MADPRQGAIESFFQDSLKAMEAAAKDRVLLASVLAISDAITLCFRRGGKVMLAGNGGQLRALSEHVRIGHLPFKLFKST